MLPFFHTLSSDLEAVEAIVNKEYKLKTGSITNLVSLELEDLDYQLRPALMLAAARAYGCSGERVRMVAGVVQFIYLATKIHATVHDEDRSSQADYQFPVLVGDYLYGHFFLGLCKSQALEYLAPLSHIILDIHEAGILRKQTKNLGEQRLLELLEREEALLCAIACKTGAQIAGASPREQELFWKFGRCVGLGIAAFSHGLAKEIIKNELEEAREALANLSVPVPALGEFHAYLELQMTEA
jgi:octaprenyl-diphosphate synthase